MKKLILIILINMSGITNSFADSVDLSMCVNNICDVETESYQHLKKENMTKDELEILHPEMVKDTVGKNKG